MIKDYFLNHDLLNSDFTLELGSKRIERLNTAHEQADWRITFVDTGQSTTMAAACAGLTRTCETRSASC
jgi:hypothetical protein